MTRLFSDGLVMMAMALGHRLGFYKLLCEATDPMTLQAISDQLGLKERYAKEWLSCMVAAEIVYFDRDSEAYYIPEAFKTELKVRTAFAPVLMQLSDRCDAVEKCFKKDGPYGVSYNDAPGYFNWLEEYRNSIRDRAMEEEILPRFREQGLAAKLESGICMLDVGCGTGTFTYALAKHFPKSTFIGMEYSEKALVIARAKNEQMQLDNVTFEYGDAQALPEKWTGHFDLVLLYDVLHDLPNPHKCLDQVYQVLKPDGVLSLVEQAVAGDPMDNRGGVGMTTGFYTPSMFVCLPSSMMGEPHVGYGAFWGIENIEKAILDHHFKISHSNRQEVEATKGRVFYCCTK